MAWCIIKGHPGNCSCPKIWRGSAGRGCARWPKGKAVRSRLSGMSVVRWSTVSSSGESGWRVPLSWSKSVELQLSFFVAPGLARRLNRGPAFLGPVHPYRSPDGIGQSATLCPVCHRLPPLTGLARLVSVGPSRATDATKQPGLNSRLPLSSFHWQGFRHLQFLDPQPFHPHRPPTSSTTPATLLRGRQLKTHIPNNHLNQTMPHPR